MSDMKSLDFVINRFFMKLFNTNVMDTVRFCQDLFGFELPGVLIAKRKAKFVEKIEQFTLQVPICPLLCCGLIILFYVS